MANITVAESEVEQVYAPLVDLKRGSTEAGNDTPIIPGWDIPTTVLAKFIDGEYCTFTNSFSDVDVLELPALSQIVKDCEHFRLSKEGAWGRSYRSRSDKKTVEQALEDYKLAHDVEIMYKYFESKADEETWSTTFLSMHEYPETTLPRATSCMVVLIKQMHTEVEDSVSTELFSRVIREIRKLAAGSKSGSDAEPEPEPEPESRTEAEPSRRRHRRRFQGINPFKTDEAALEALVKYLDLVLIHYRTAEYHYGSAKKLGFGDGQDGFSGNFHWACLHEFLQREIQQNGPIPEQLWRFYATVELTHRLGELTEQRLDELEVGNPELAETVSAIRRARTHFRIVDKV